MIFTDPLLRKSHGHPVKRAEPDVDEGLEEAWLAEGQAWEHQLDEEEFWDDTEVQD